VRVLWQLTLNGWTMLRSYWLLFLFRSVLKLAVK
jgi:hypothetical protein